MEGCLESIDFFLLNTVAGSRGVLIYRTFNLQVFDRGFLGQLCAGAKRLILYLLLFFTCLGKFQGRGSHYFASSSLIGN